MIPERRDDGLEGDTRLSHKIDSEDLCTSMWVGVESSRSKELMFQDLSYLSKTFDQCSVIQLVV